MSWRIRICQTGISPTAGLVMLVLFHWLMTQPSPLDMVRVKCAHGFAPRCSGGASLVWVTRLMLGSLGLGWLIAVVIASLALASRSPDNIAGAPVWRGRSALAAAAGTLSRGSPYTPCTGRRSDGNHQNALFGWRSIPWLASHSCGRHIVDSAISGYPRQNPGQEWARYDLQKTWGHCGTWRVGAMVVSKTGRNSLQIGGCGCGKELAPQRRTYRALLSRRHSHLVPCIALCVGDGSGCLTAGPARSRQSAHIVSGTVLPVVSLAMGLGLTLPGATICTGITRFQRDRDRWAWLEQAIF